MDVGTGFLCQHQVPGNHQILGNGRTSGKPQLPGYLSLIDCIVLYHLAVLTVGDDNFMQLFCGFQSVTHPNRRSDGNTVVGKSYGTGSSQRVKIRQRFALLSHGHCADGQHMAEALLFALFQHIFHLLRGIQHGLGIGHAGNGGKAARCCCRAAGDDVLFISKTGIPEVNVHIHKTRSKIQPGAVDDFVPLGGNSRCQSGDHAVLYQKIHGGGSD